MSNQMFSECSPGYDTLASLFDEGTFVELGAYVKRKGSEAEYEGVVCGYGAINERLVFAFAQEGERLGGAVDKIHAEKIKLLYKAAKKSGAPVIGIFNSRGIMMKEGFSSVAACGKILKCISDASGVIPQIAVINGVCAGTMAAAVSAFDIAIAVKEKSLMYIASPSALGASYGKSEYIAQKGLAALVAENSDDAIAKARELVCFLPDNCDAMAKTTANDEPSRVSDFDVDSKNFVGNVVDNGKLTELYSAYEPSMFTAFGSVGGISVGIAANNASVDGGRITSAGALKAARFIELCDSFGIPVLTFVDSQGAAQNASEEDARLSSSLSKLAMSYASSTNAKVTLVCGKAYGASAVLMGSKSLGADVVYALKDSSIGALSPEAAVAFMNNDAVGKEGSRNELEQQWNEQNLSPVCAAEIGEIDDIISPSEARARICSALYMLEKSNYKIERKHCVSPL